jgi:hypothetical protein
LDELRAPLKVGLLVNSLEVPAWVESVVAEMVAADWIDLQGVVRNATPSAKRSLGERLSSARSNFLYGLYTRFDGWRNRTSPERNPFHPTDLKPWLEGVDVIDVTPRQTRFSDYIEDEDLERIRGLNPDVLVRFGFRILRGEILQVPRFGVWSFHHGDGRVNRGSMPGFWEVMEGESTTGSMLQVLSEKLDAGKVVDRFFGATDARSVVLNQRNLYRKTAPMLMDGLRHLKQQGEEGLYEKSDDFPAYYHPLRKLPRNADMARSLPRLASSFVGAKARHVFRFDQWFLAYRVRKNPTDPNLAFYQYTHMLPPKDRFWADPFAVRREGGYGVFFEEFLFSKNKAHISYFEIDEDGKHSEPRVVLDTPYHLSYPFVFEYDGDLFMIPESQANRSVELWRCTSFPDKWKLERVLMDDHIAADTTLFERDGKWWMFAAVTEDGLQNRDRLELFHADEPTGPWIPHPMNPIKRDVRSARPAGKLISDRGRLLRPAQDCAGRYGAAIAINEITEWTHDRYSERTITRITPDWRPHLLATHTINTVGDLTIIDGEMLRRRWG